MNYAATLPRTYQRPALRGLSGPTPAQLTQQIGSITGTAATGALSALVLAHVMTAATASLAIPLVGAGIMAVTAGIALILNSGCGQSCILTSNWANQVEQLLQQNIQSYFALPAPRSNSAKAVALANFDNAWNYLVQECSQAGLSTAGMNCTKDRMRGACTWRQTATSPLLQYPGEPGPGMCWNWFSGYRDPIANDATVSDDAATPVLTGQTGTPDGGTVAEWALYAGIAFLAVGMLRGNS